MTTSDPQTPRTAAGRRLFTDNEPMDMLESDGVTWEDVIAIEAEATALAQGRSSEGAATGAKPDLAERLAKALHEASNTIGCMGAYESCISRDEHERAARIAATGAKPDLLEPYGWRDVVVTIGGKVDERTHAYNGNYGGRTLCGLYPDTLSSRSVWRIARFDRCEPCEVEYARLAASKEERP